MSREPVAAWADKSDPPVKLPKLEMTAAQDFAGRKAHAADKMLNFMEWAQLSPETREYYVRKGASQV